MKSERSAKTEASGSEQKLSFVQSDEFISSYANNVGHESNVFDIRFVFGEIRGNAAGRPEILQHTGVTMPWSAAKIACFHLAINIIGFESQHGPIKLPSDALPLVMGLNAAVKSDPRIIAVLHALMSVGNPEIFPADSKVNMDIIEKS